MPANKKVGVSDIAKHAGVSIGTVSNYLNYPERVSETLKTKISRAIADLGYVPKHSNGQIPASNATPVIGFVMTDIEHSLFTSIFEAHRRCARTTACRSWDSTHCPTNSGKAIWCGC